MENVSEEKHEPQGDVKEKKGNPVVNYFKGAIAELRKVSWPTRKETWRKAWIVIGFSAAFALFLGLVDYLMTALIQTIL
jgi:preprotein translocase subunit SecE